MITRARSACPTTRSSPFSVLVSKPWQFLLFVPNSQTNQASRPMIYIPCKIKAMHNMRACVRAYVPQRRSTRVDVPSVPRLQATSPATREAQPCPRPAPDPSAPSAPPPTLPPLAHAAPVWGLARLRTRAAAACSSQPGSLSSRSFVSCTVRSPSNSSTPGTPSSSRSRLMRTGPELGAESRLGFCEARGREPSTDVEREWVADGIGSSGWPFFNRKSRWMDQAKRQRTTHRQPLQLPRMGDDQRAPVGRGLRGILHIPGNPSYICKPPNLKRTSPWLHWPALQAPVHQNQRDR